MMVWGAAGHAGTYTRRDCETLVGTGEKRNHRFCPSSRNLISSPHDHGGGHGRQGRLTIAEAVAGLRPLLRRRSLDLDLRTRS